MYTRCPTLQRKKAVSTPALEKTPYVPVTESGTKQENRKSVHTVFLLCRETRMSVHTVFLCVHTAFLFCFPPAFRRRPGVYLYIRLFEPLLLPCPPGRMRGRMRPDQSRSTAVVGITRSRGSKCRSPISTMARDSRLTTYGDAGQSGGARVSLIF